MRSGKSFLLLAIFALGVWFSHGRAVHGRHDVMDVADREGGTAIPGIILKLISLEFDGILADHLLLRGLTFSGRMQEDLSIINDGNISEEDLPLNNPRRWDWFTAQLHAAILLDPHFLDPYFIGYNNLVWTAKRYKEANLLLDEGIASRTWDWLLPFNAGFNAFYFLQDREAGARYLMTAAVRPGAAPLLGTLAARLSYEEHQTANAIIFLKQLLRDAQEEDATSTHLLRERLEALEGIYAIEQAVAKYREAYGEMPFSLSTLLKDGYLMVIPKDPYGGEFYLEADGKVKTTSDLGRKKG